MEDIRNEQKEALETLVEFNEKLVKNMNIIVKELSGQRLDDTDKFLKGIIDAVNWEVQVLNGTMSLLNEDKERINKEIMRNKRKHILTLILFCSPRRIRRIGNHCIKDPRLESFDQF